MKKTLLLLGALAAIAFGADTKIGYIDSDRIFREFQGASEAKQTFETEMAKFKGEAEVLQRKYDAAKAEYDQQKLMLSEEARTAKESQLNALRQQYESFVQDIYGKGGKIETKNSELMAPLVKQINTSVQAIAQAEGYTIVLDMAQGAMVYALPGLDLTAKVIAELNKQYQPIAIAPAFKQRVAVFYLTEQNSDAKNFHLGRTCRSYIEQIIGDRYKSKMETVDQSKISTVLQTKGLAEEMVDATSAQDVALQVGADYYITGKVLQEGNEITVECMLSQVKSNRTFDAEQKKAAKSDLLRDTLGELLLTLFAKNVP